MRNLAIAKALGSQMKAALIALGERSKNGAQAIVPLGRGQLFLRIGRRIEALLNQASIRLDLFANLMSGEPVLQSKIMRHAKKPATEILAGAAELQMAMQRKKYFLDDLFAVVQREAERKSVAQQAAAKFIEQADDFRFHRGGRRRQRGISRRPQREPQGI